MREGIPGAKTRMGPRNALLAGRVCPDRAAFLCIRSPARWGQTRPTLRFMRRRTGMENCVSNRGAPMGMVSFGMGCRSGRRWASRQRRSQAACLTGVRFESARSFLFSIFSFTHPI